MSTTSRFPPSRSSFGRTFSSSTFSTALCFWMRPSSAKLFGCAAPPGAFHFRADFPEDVHQVVLARLVAPGPHAGLAEGSGLGEARDVLHGRQVVDADDVLDGAQAHAGALADDLLLLQGVHVHALVLGGGLADDVVGHDAAVHLLGRDCGRVLVVAQRGSTSILVIFIASSTVLPMIISHIMSLEAIAVPQPKVLNLASRILSLSRSTAQNARMASPQTSAPQSATTRRAPREWPPPP